jgi:hypothetical protein
MTDIARLKRRSGVHGQNSTNLPSLSVTHTNTNLITKYNKLTNIWFEIITSSEQTS